MYLTTIGGRLCLVTNLDGSDSGFWSLQFWTLTDYTKGIWSFECHVKFLIHDEFTTVHLPVPVDIQNDKVLLASGRRLYIHDLKNIATTDIDCDFPFEDPLNNARCFQPDHAEMLVPLFSMI